MPTSLLVLLAILAGVVLVWSLLGLKTSRPDGTYIKTHPYRRLFNLWVLNSLEPVSFAA